MQNQIIFGAAKYPTAVTTSTHTFGSFTRILYEFEYTKTNDPEIYKFRGSNIDYCLHGHPWLICCTPMQIVPKAPEPQVLPNTENQPTPNIDQSSIEPASLTHLQKLNLPREPPVPSTIHLSISGHAVTSKVNMVKSNPTTSQCDSKENSKFFDDPEAFIESAPLYEHYMKRLINHDCLPEYNVDLTLLLPGSKRPRKKQQPPRPPNSYMIYSLHIKSLKTDIFATNKEKTKRSGSQFHVELGNRWKLLPTKHKEFFTILADFAKHLHAEVYPDYVYTPTRKKKMVTK